MFGVFVYLVHTPYWIVGTLNQGPCPPSLCHPHILGEALGLDTWYLLVKVNHIIIRSLKLPVISTIITDQGEWKDTIFMPSLLLYIPHFF